MSVQITCGECGNTSPYTGWINRGGHDLKPSDWCCPSCNVYVRIKDVPDPPYKRRVVSILRPGRKAAA